MPRTPRARFVRQMPRCIERNEQGRIGSRFNKAVIRMLKVECESWRAPYQVDERRVPPGGLKMRCPTCGLSFMVNAPGGGAAAQPVAPAAPPPQVSKAPPIPKGAPAGAAKPAV